VGRRVPIRTDAACRAALSGLIHACRWRVGPCIMAGPKAGPGTLLEHQKVSTISGYRPLEGG